MDDEDFDEEVMGGVLTQCSNCGSPFLDVVGRKTDNEEDVFCELLETHKCSNCGRTFQQTWIAQYWTEIEGEEEKAKRFIILKDGTEVVIGKKDDKKEDGIEEPLGVRTEEDDLSF